MSRRTAIVTRCTQRLVGSSCALRLAEDGCNVAICDDPSQQAELSQLKREIESKGVKCCSYVCDQSNEQDVKNLIGNVVEDLGGVDIVVATFHGTPLAPASSTIVSMSAEDFDKSLAIRPRSFFLILKHTSAQMIKQGHGGRVIGLTTMAALQAVSPHLSAYCAGCFATRGLMQTAALELGQHSITVNLLSHSVLQDPAAESAIAALSSLQPGWDLQESQKFIANRTPLPKKSAASQDIVPVVSMLASKECDFMTGQTISVNGGLLMN
ncbi:NAD(P)-binding protein [Hymenopellis radicata]|nr:NAD(P)-binding protein [Hymenopellis radicata]